MKIFDSAGRVKQIIIRIRRIYENVKENSF